MLKVVSCVVVVLLLYCEKASTNDVRSSLRHTPSIVQRSRHGSEEVQPDTERYEDRLIDDSDEETGLEISPRVGNPSANLQRLIRQGRTHVV